MKAVLPLGLSRTVIDNFPHLPYNHTGFAVDACLCQIQPGVGVFAYLALRRILRAMAERGGIAESIL
jgi:hypothetical protein